MSSGLLDTPMGPCRALDRDPIGSLQHTHAHDDPLPQHIDATSRVFVLARRDTRGHLQLRRRHCDVGRDLRTSQRGSNISNRRHTIESDGGDASATGNGGSGTSSDAAPHHLRGLGLAAARVTQHDDALRLQVRAKGLHRRVGDIEHMRLRVPQQARSQKHTSTAVTP
jgi:hypothetical protein